MVQRERFRAGTPSTVPIDQPGTTCQCNVGAQGLELWDKCRTFELRDAHLGYVKRWAGRTGLPECLGAKGSGFTELPVSYWRSPSQAVSALLGPAVCLQFPVCVVYSANIWNLHPGRVFLEESKFCNMKN